ncbi:restriction endonuclease, partial [Enterococcus sp. GC34]
SSGFNPVLSRFAKTNYPNSKSDLFAMFIERWNKSIKSDGYNSLVTMQSWMFLSSYENMRKNIILNYTINNMMHMENMVMGIAFGTVVTIFQKVCLKNFKGTYHQIKTEDVSNGKIPSIIPIPGNRFNQINQNEFNKIPGQPISYWVSENLIHDFVVGKRMDEIVEPKQGLATANNNRFLREWWEVDINRIKFDATSISDSVNSGKKWFPYNKGGAFRRWYGNYDYVVNWENDGQEIRNFVDDKGKLRSRPQNTEYYFKEAITWGKVSSSTSSFRWKEEGNIFADAGMSIFFEDTMKNYILGLLNSKVANEFLKILSPTMNYEVGHISHFPVLEPIIEDMFQVNNCISIAKNDWDSLEISWNFKHSPLT